MLLFQFPLTVRSHSENGLADRTILVKEKSEDFLLRIDESPGWCAHRSPTQPARQDQV